MRTMDDEALAAIAQRLYGLRPEEFTRARDGEVKQAKADGDRAGAAAIAALRRPSLAAWLVNALVRERSAEIEQLLGLGEALAAAQRGLAGGEVREQARRAEEARRRAEEARRREEERRAAELAQAREEEHEAQEALTAALETSRAAQARLDDAEHAEEDARRRIADLQEQLRRA